MRKMRCHGEDKIMMVGIHDLNLASRTPPQLSYAADSGGMRPFRRRQNTPPTFEQFGESSLGTRVFRARDRMAGNQMDPVRDVWRQGIDDGAFDRTDIGYNRSRASAKVPLPRRWRRTCSPVNI